MLTSLLSTVYVPNDNEDLSQYVQYATASEVMPRYSYSASLVN